MDVVVVGSGIAGLSAAYETARRGASVVILESEQLIGGASRMSGAACCLVGTPEQEAAGITDDVERALADWARFGGPTADLQWAEAYLRNSRAEVHDWCEEMGVRWSAPMWAEGNSVARWHLPDSFGPGIVDGVLERLKPFGVQILRGVQVTSLIVEEGSVRGVRCTGDPTRTEIRSSSVIMCTGGFVNNRDMLRRSAPELFVADRVLCGGAPTARGLGHEVIEEIGGQLVAMDNVWVYPYGTPDPQDPTGSRGLGLRGATTELWLNRSGRRFHDESLRGAHSGTRALTAQDGQTAWCVFDDAEADGILLIDNEYYATPFGPHPEAMASFWQESPHAIRSVPAAELAEFTGIPVEALTATIEEFDAAVRAGLDHDPATARSLEGLSEVGTDSLAAIQLFPMAQKNFGGVLTDLTCNVIGADGEPVRGLYAAGELAGMAGGSINGQNGLEGTMFGPSLYSGRIAGRSAELNG